ncbi:18634_t:CDS:2, partial [Gigaspora rosea]
MFDLEEVLDEDEVFEQIRSPAATTNLVERIKNIMSELFERYYKFDDDKILFLTTAIDPRCKNYEYEGAILKGQDYLRLEYDQIISDEGLGSSSSKAALDLSGSFISTVFIAVQQNTTHKNEADHKNLLPKTASIAQKFLAIPLTSVSCEQLFSQCGI